MVYFPLDMVAECGERSSPSASLNMLYMRYLLIVHEKGDSTQIFVCAERRDGTQGCHRTSFKSVHLISPESLSSLHYKSSYLSMASQPDKKFVISSHW